MLVNDGFLPAMGDVTAGRGGRQHKGETTSRSGSYQVMSCPACGHFGVGGQIHSKTTPKGVGVTTSHTGAEAESIIYV
jgi:hypothetical protein